MAAGDDTDAPGSMQQQHQQLRSSDVEVEESTLDEVVAANPHCAQLRAAPARPFLAAALQPRKVGDVDRFLSPAWPRMRYCKRPDADRSSCHWGQLKLLECELKCLTDFLTRARAGLADGGPPDIAGASPLVVYVGAAPGRHVPSLARRFPACRFELYDPAEFDPKLVDLAESEQGGRRIRLVRGFFDEDAAKNLVERLRSCTAKDGGGPLVFFSDIRTADEQLMTPAEVEQSICRDMERQRSWVEALRPAVALLKFRLPWGPGQTRYLRGRLLVQAFPPCTSTETRLLVDANDLGDATYDHEEYEERLMHHNTVGRSQLHDLPVPVGSSPGLDRCYDCAALVATVQRYVAARSRVDPEAVSEEDISAELSALLSEVGGHGGRTLATPYHVSSSRHSGKQFARRRYTNDVGQDCFAVERQHCPHKKRRRKTDAVPSLTSVADATSVPETAAA